MQTTHNYLGLKPRIFNKPIQLTENKFELSLWYNCIVLLQLTTFIYPRFNPYSMVL